MVQIILLIKWVSDGSYWCGYKVVINNFGHTF
jgi:hypothetical protein